MATKRTQRGSKPTDEISQRQMDRYLERISGPLIDRIDIHVEVPPVPYRQLTGERNGTDSATMRQQVLAARRVQIERNGSSLKPNSTLNGQSLDKHAALDDEAKGLLKEAMASLGLSARAYDKVRRVARTIADVEGNENINVSHVGEAVQYRLLDRRM